MKKSNNSNPLKTFNDNYDKKVKKVNEGNKKLVKAQTGGDSTKYYNDENKFQWELAQNASKFGLRESAEKHVEKARKAKKDAERQGFKNKPGFDASGFPIKSKKK